MCLITTVFFDAVCSFCKYLTWALRLPVCLFNIFLSDLYATPTFQPVYKRLLNVQYPSYHLLLFHMQSRKKLILSLYSVLCACTYFRPEPLFFAGFKLITAQASRHAFTRKLHSSTFLVKAWREVGPWWVITCIEEHEFVSFPIKCRVLIKYLGCMVFLLCICCCQELCFSHLGYLPLSLQILPCIWDMHNSFLLILSFCLMHEILR